MFYRHSFYVRLSLQRFWVVVRWISRRQHTSDTGTRGVYAKTIPNTHEHLLCRAHTFTVYIRSYLMCFYRKVRDSFSRPAKTFPLTFTTHRPTLVHVITHNNVQPRISSVCNSVPYTRHYDRYTTTSLIYRSRIVASRRGRRTRSKNFLEVHNNKKSI